MIKTKDYFGLSIPDALAALQAFEAAGASEARVVRKMIDCEARAVTHLPLVSQLWEAAEELAAGHFLFPGRIEDIVLDVATLMIVCRDKKRVRIDFWLKDSALQVLSGIHVTQDGAKLEHYTVRDRKEIKCFKDVPVYGFSLSDWLAGDPGNRTGSLWPEQPEGVFDADDNGVFLRFRTPERFTGFSRSSRTQLEVSLYAEAMEGSAIAKRRLGNRRALKTQEKVEVRLTAGDAMELTALAQKGGVLRMGDAFYPFGADFMDAGFRRGWRQASSGVPTGCGSVSSTMIRMPWALFPKVAQNLSCLSLGEKELVAGLLNLQAEAAGIG